MWIRNSYVAVTVALLGCSSESECLEKKTCTTGSIDAAKPETGEGGAPTEPVASGGRGDVASGGAPSSSKGGSGPGPTATSVGAACDGEGERICNTTGSGSILECVDGEWKRLESCVRGSRCDTSQVRCAPIVPGCERLAAGSSFCRAQTRVTCGPDLVTSEEEECAGRCAGGNCVAASCGDGVPQEEEVCDDGNTDDDDACTSACELPACGDGIVSAGEECDDGNDDNSDGCTSDCVAAECGNGVVEGEEECDDGNDDETDSCLNTCEAVVCGDGLIAGAEECDDANTDDDDACPSTCKNAECGDGFVWAGHETCDDANPANDDECTDRCTAEPVSLALGGDHTCALFQNGALKCWGDNKYGQIGPYPDSAIGDDPADLGKNLPIILTGVTEVAAGARHTCVLKDEAVQCWGDNTSKQLGPGAVGTSRARPGTVELGGSAESICAAGTWSAALMSDGTVKIWGIEDRGNPEGDLAKFPGFANITRLACGSNWICGTDNSNQAICLAPSLTSVENHAEIVDRSAVPSDAAFEQLAVGYHAACVIGDGTAYCCGSNFNGQLVPAEETGLPLVSLGLNKSDPGGIPRIVDAEGGVTCFVLTNGEVRCWGSSYDGVLGQPEITSADPDAGYLGWADGTLGWQLPAIKLGIGARVKSVATSGSHTCALLEDNRVKCWGRNGSGQLGIGDARFAVGDDPGEMDDALPFASIE